MGFYIRKSIRVGPLRFNLSKSGIGVSAGIRGLRVGTGPRGNYIHMGRGGLYYRQTLPSRLTPSDGYVESPPVTPDYAARTTHGPMRAITSGSVTQMADSSSAALLGELESKRRQIRFWPLAATFSVAVPVLLIVAAVSPWITIPLAVLLLAGTFLVYQRDILRKSVVMMYDLDDESACAYRELHDAVASLGRCGATWHTHAQADVYDPKYHAGAGHLVKRKRIHVGESDPPFVRTNLSVHCVPLSNKSLYFFPDRLLVYARNGVGAVNYDELRCEVDSTHFIEEESVPRDATIVDRTWRYVNRSGGPDRRFKDNRELPVCLYEEIRLRSRSGLNELLQVSRTGMGAELERAVASMASSIAAGRRTQEQRKREAGTVESAEAVQGSGRNQSGSSVRPEIPPPDEIYAVLFDVLCCVMVADGRASRSEKTRIRELMHRVGASWTPSLIEDRIGEFIQRVQGVGFKSVLSDALSRVPLFKQIGREDALLQCVDSLVAADAELAPGEMALCARIREILA